MPTGGVKLVDAENTTRVAWLSPFSPSPPVSLPSSISPASSFPCLLTSSYK